ncbi:MAG: magnesium/cobalt efflux protein, partial [Methylomonas sp.]
LRCLEHFPKKGEKVEIEPFCFEVLRADNRRVHLLKLKIR